MDCKYVKFGQGILDPLGLFNEVCDTFKNRLRICYTFRVKFGKINIW